MDHQADRVAASGCEELRQEQGHQLPAGVERTRTEEDSESKASIRATASGNETGDNQGKRAKFRGRLW